MSISSVLLPRLSGLLGCNADNNYFEREVLNHRLRDKEVEKERQETVQETHIVESADSADLFFIWPVPLIFDEFTVD